MTDGMSIETIKKMSLAAHEDGVFNFLVDILS